MTRPGQVAASAAFVAGCLAIALGATAQSHIGNCAQKSGIEKARCERHEKMYARCGPVKGEAHFACDREFLLANPLDCRAVGTDTSACAAEGAAFKSCESNEGRAFMRCVRDLINANPQGH